MSVDDGDYSGVRGSLPRKNYQGSASSVQKVNHFINGRAVATINQALSSSVDKLPPEILLQIFCLTMWREPRLSYPPFNPSQLHDHHKQPFALSQVCSYWRVLALGVPSLWSCVHLTLGAMKDSMKSCNLAQLFLQRTQNAPLSFWVNGQNNISDSGMNMMVECLRPYFKRVESFNLFNQRHPNRVRRLVSAWMTHGQADSIRTVTIWLHDDLRKNMYLTRGATSPQRWDSFLEPIRVLRLRGGFPYQRNLVSRNLLVLQLENTSTTASRLLQTLSTCSRLQILKLREIEMYSLSVGESNPANPVTLTEVKHLQIRRIYGLPSFLRNLLVSPQGLSFSVDLYDSRENSLAIKAFLERSRVRTLRIFNTGPKIRIYGYLSSCRDLETLILRCEALDEYGHNPSAGHTPTVWFGVGTGSHELHITNGLIGNERVIDVLEMYLRSTLASSASSFAPPIDPCVFELFCNPGDRFIQLEPFIKHVSSTQLGKMDPDFPDLDSNFYP